MKLKDNPDLQLEIKGGIEELEILLTELDFGTEKNREKIVSLLSNVIFFENNLEDSGEKHDYVNGTLFLKEIEADIEEISKDDAIEYFGYGKDKLISLVEVKSNFSINEIKNLLLVLSKENNINIDLNIHDSIVDSDGRSIFIKKGEVDDIDLSLVEGGKFLSLEKYRSEKFINKIGTKIKSLITGEDHSFKINYNDLDLKNIYPNINFELHRLFQNLVKNSKEAGADNISVTFETGYENLIVKYLDNGLGMNNDIILNKMFVQGESTKKTSGKNFGEGMHGMAKLFNEKGVGVDVYSKTDEGYFAKGFLAQSFDSVIKNGSFNKTSYVDLDDKEYYLDSGKFPNETGIEFVFKFPIENNKK